MKRRRALRFAFRLSVLALAAVCGCSARSDAQAYAELEGIRESADAVTRGALEFSMEASFRDPETGESGVLYAVDGEAEYDTAMQIAYQRFRMTRLGATADAEEYYADGVKTHVEKQAVTTSPVEPDVLFGAFPYRLPPLPALSSLEELEREENGTGLLWTTVCGSGQKELLGDVWGLDLYALAGISLPDREKESYGDVTCTWVTDGDSLKSVYVQLDVTLYEQSGYTPGYGGENDDGRLDLTVRTRFTVTGTGETVEIPAYEAGD